MSNSSRGIAFERVVRADLAEYGWTTFRTPASKGPADVIAIGPGPEVLFVQVKIDGRLDPKPWDELVALARWNDAVPLMAWRPARGRLAYRRLLREKGDGGGWQPWDEWIPYEVTQKGE